MALRASTCGAPVVPLRPTIPFSSGSASRNWKSRATSMPRTVSSGFFEASIDPASSRAALRRSSPRPSPRSCKPCWIVFRSASFSAGDGRPVASASNSGIGLPFPVARDVVAIADKILGALANRPDVPEEERRGVGGRDARRHVGQVAAIALGQAE